MKDALGVAHCVRGELVMKLIFFPDADETKPVNKNGSLLLQTLFSFKKPISVSLLLKCGKNCFMILYGFNLSTIPESAILIFLDC